MLDSFLKILCGKKAERVVWNGDITYWISGQKQAGTADPKWDTEEGYLKLHCDLGLMAYYNFARFWAGQAQYAPEVELSGRKQGNRTINRIKTPVGELTQENVYLEDSCSVGCTKHYVESKADLDVMQFIIEHRRMVPCNLDDYHERRERWQASDGLPAIALPRSPLAAFCYEWAGVQNMVYLLLDCKEQVTDILRMMAEQDKDVLDALCDTGPPLVHFADNLSGENFGGLYQEYLAEDHRRRLARLHECGVRCVVHLDGTVRGLLRQLVDAGFDAIEALTPEPVGDLGVDEMNRLAGSDSVILWGGVPGAMFSPPYTWAEMKAHVLHVLECWRDRPFVLGVADQVPPDGNIEFCRRIADLLQEG